MSKDLPDILFVAIQSAHSSNGGMESATRIFEALSAEARWSLLTNRDSEFTRRWQDGGASIEIVPFAIEASRMMRGLGQLRFARAVRKRLGLRRPDISHANDIRSLRALSGSGEDTGKLIFTVRDTKTAGSAYGKEWHEATAACSRIVTLSREMAAILRTRLPANDPAKYRTIHSIVDLNRFAPTNDANRSSLRGERGITKDEFAIGVVGAVMAKKRQRDIIEAVVPEVSGRIAKAGFHFIGDFAPERSDYAKDCEDAVCRLDLANHVTFHGHSKNIADWLKSLDVILIASEREGLARAMIEGMSCAVPVVSADVCSAREMLEKTGAGFVVKGGEYATLAEKLLNLGNDPKMRAEMGAAGRRTAESLFSEAGIRSAWLDLYADLAQRAAPDGR